MAMTNLWSLLPENLQLKILSLIPTSKSKLVMRFVSKGWGALLDCPEAHLGRTLDLHDVDEDISLWQKTDTPLQYRKHAKVLSLYYAGDLPMKLSSERQNLASVAPLQALEELYITVNSACSLDALPLLQNLKGLYLWECKYLEPEDIEATGTQEPPALLSCLLPKLEVLDLRLMPQDTVAVCQDLESFLSLRSLMLECYEPDSLDVNGEIGIPEGCSVALRIYGAACESAAGVLPGSLKASIREVSLRLPGELTNYNIGLFSVCSALIKLEVEVEDWAEKHALLLLGVETLPANLKSFSVTSKTLPAFITRAYDQAVASVVYKGTDSSGFGLWVYNLKCRG